MSPAATAAQPAETFQAHHEDAHADNAGGEDKEEALPVEGKRGQLLRGELFVNGESASEILVGAGMAGGAEASEAGHTAHRRCRVVRLHHIMASMASDARGGVEAVEVRPRQLQHLAVGALQVRVVDVAPEFIACHQLVVGVAVPASLDSVL